MNTIDSIVEKALRVYEQKSWPHGLKDLLDVYAKNVAATGQPTQSFFCLFDQKLIREYQAWFRVRGYEFYASQEYQVQICKKSLFPIYPEHSN